MQFIIGIICGMLTMLIHKAFLWLLIPLLSPNPKHSLAGLCLGIGLINYSLPKQLSEFHLNNVKVQQITQTKNRKALLEILLAAPPLQAGDKIISKQKLNFYHGQATCTLACEPLVETNNALQPSSKWYYMAQNIRAQCRPSKCSNISFIHNIKTLLESAIPNGLENSDVFKALLLGQGYLVDWSKKDLFKYSGLAHLIAVSGLHIGIIANIVSGLFGFVWRLSINVFWRIPKSYFCSFGACFGALLYAWLSGFGDSGTRALAMVLVANIAKLGKFSLAGENILLIALALCLMITPLKIFSLGFWLSVIAVWALLQAKNNLFWAQANIILVMLPMQAALQWPIGWWMPLFNLMAIPFFSVIIVPAAFFIWLLALFWPSISIQLWHMLDHVISWFFSLINYVKAFTGNGVIIVANDYWHVCLIGLLSYALIKRLAKSALLILLLLVLELNSSVQTDEFIAKVINVGQGLSVLIRTKNHNILYDTGSLFMANKAVIPLLKSEGIKKIDYLLISHGDHDHSGGVYVINKTFAVQNIIAGEPNRLSLPATLCRNRSFLIDGVIFTTYKAKMNNKHNNASCILHVESFDKSLLIPGDIEQDAEQVILNNIALGELSASYLIAPHHGSKSSGSKAFIAAVKPKVIIVSAGRYARFKHPAKANVQYWLQQGIKVKNTAVSGSLQL